MKRILSWLLVLTLLLSGVPSALAQVTNADIAIDSSGSGVGDIPSYVESLTATSDGLYMPTFDNVIYKWSLATGEITPLVSEGYNLRLIANGDTLYNLMPETGLLCPVTITEDKAVIAEIGLQLQWELITGASNEEFYYPQIYAAFCSGNTLYLQTSRSDMDDWYTRGFYAFDLETGKGEELYAGREIYSICPYKDGKLLAIRFDEQKYYSSEDQSTAALPWVQVFDPQTKAFTDKLFTMETIDCCGLAYNPATDTVYYTIPGNVYFSQGGQAPAQLTYVPVSYGGSNTSALLLGGTHYVVFSNGNAVYIRSLDPSHKPAATLRISGGDFQWTGREGFLAFTKAHPEIAIVPTENSYFESAEKIFQHMKTDSAADVYTLYNIDSLDALIEKGYCLDLTGTPAISALSNDMYPHISSAFTRDGKIYALPYSASIYNTMAYSPSLLKEIGLTEADLPTNLDQLLDFIADWVDIYSLDYPNLDLINHNYFKLRSHLIQLIFQQQIAYCSQKGIPTTFDTPEMLALLKKVDSMSSIFKEIDPSDEELEGGWGWSSDDPLVALLDFSHDVFNDYSDNTDYVPLKLNYVGDVPMYTMLYMSVLIVNPYSKNQEVALEFLSDMASNLKASFKIILSPNYNEPIENAYYERSKKNLEEYMLSVQESLEKATDDLEKKNLEEQLANMEPWRQSVENSRYEVSPERLAIYRDMALTVTPSTSSYSLFANAENLQTLYQRYIEQQIGAEQYIKETEKVLQKIHRESK